MKFRSDLKFALLAVSIIGVIILGSSFQGNAPAPAKNYTLSMSMDEWVKTANGIQYTMNKLRQSDLPSKEVALITDSVLVPFLSQIQSQIGAQAQAEEKAKADAMKKDSTKPKKQLP